MGLFGCTQKTVAMGVPLITTMYENDPLRGLISLPLLIWYVMQLVLGSILLPRLAAYVDRESARLGLPMDDKPEESNDDGVTVDNDIDPNETDKKNQEVLLSGSGDVPSSDVEEGATETDIQPGSSMEQSV